VKKLLLIVAVLCMYFCAIPSMEPVPVEDIAVEERDIFPKFDSYIKLINNSSQEQFFNYTNTSKEKRSIPIRPGQTIIINVDTVRDGLTNIKGFSWYYNNDNNEFYVMGPQGGKSSVYVGDNNDVIITVTFTGSKKITITLSTQNRTVLI
jgi:hypothetical protein